MRPVGLVFKDASYNAYIDSIIGELMVVHICLGCGKISGNRIAGDDNPYSIIGLLETPSALPGELTARLKYQGIVLLSRNDEQTVRRILYGNSGYAG